MDNKWSTLSTIYNIVKDNPKPTKTLLNINELILKQSIPWDVVVSHLKELQKEEYINIQQLSVAVISLTDKGMEYFEGIPKANIT